MMGRNYWTKIGIGMVAVFGVAWVIYRVGGSALDHAKGAITTAASALTTTPGLFDVGFRLDGDSVGGVERLQLMRSVPRRTDSAVVTVRMQDAGTVSRMAQCHVMLNDAHHFNRSTSFSCATAADSARLSLVPFGHFVVEPGDAKVTLWVPAKLLAQFQHENTGVSGVGDTGDVDIQSSAGHLSISVGGHEIVDAVGDSGGGSLVIRDSHGNPIVQISGDSSGGSVKVMDSQGHTRVDINGKNPKKTGGP